MKCQKGIFVYNIQFFFFFQYYNNNNMIYTVSGKYFCFEKEIKSKRIE